FSNVELTTALPVPSNKPLLYSTLETQTMSSTDRRVVLVTPTRIEAPTWLADAHPLIYNSGDRVYRVPAPGGKPDAIHTRTETRLTNAKGLDDGPEYSPDGKFIFFNSDRTGMMQIWRMRNDGSEQEQFTMDEFNNCFPHPSPDGRSLVFLSYEKDVTGHPENK